MVRCRDEERSIPMPQCAFEAKCLQCLIAHLRNYRSQCLIVRLRQIAFIPHHAFEELSIPLPQCAFEAYSRSDLVRRLRTNQRILAAAAAHEGLRQSECKCE